MSADLVETIDDTTPFFAPCSSDVVDRLIAEYQARRKQIDQMAAIAQGELGNVIHYFIEGNAGDERLHRSIYVDKLFKPAGAIFALNSAYWSKAMQLTDVYDYMPQARRDYWNAQLKGDTTLGGYNGEKIPPLPDFEEATVRDTLASLLGMRAKFLAERVDGLFRSLSGDHVTNVPEGFSKRMILAYMLSYGSINHSRAGVINDLRCVIAKFMGRDEPKYRASDVAIRHMYHKTGEWHTLDGGALRIRVYKKGTAHLEVHPDMAWRLNLVLSSLYPTAIPAKFRAKPPKRPKSHDMMERPLPFSVLELLATDQRYTPGEKLFRFEASALEKKSAFSEAVRILTSMGGVLQKTFEVSFDYAYREVLTEIIMTGCVPDKVSHQFYPTPATLAELAVQMAVISGSDTVLEPSAGQGDLASYLPKDRTTCVEISSLHCAILKARGFNTVEADFTKWAASSPTVDAIVMNPPFADGRAQVHVEMAAALVKPGGRLVAILPASFKGKQKLLPADWAVEWSSIYSGEFVGTSVSVVILKGTKPTEA
jgi:hypothetical protein